MTGPPIKVLAWREGSGSHSGRWEDAPVHWLAGTEAVWMVRTDAPPEALAELPGVQALIAAGYGAAEKAAFDWWDGNDRTLPHDRIRALTPADATAALERIVEERVKAIASRLASMKSNDIDSFDVGYDRAIDDAIAAIREVKP